MEVFEEFTEEFRKDMFNKADNDREFAYGLGIVLGANARFSMPLRLLPNIDNCCNETRAITAKTRINFMVASSSVRTDTIP